MKEIVKITKVKSFTLMEMIVVMAITSIVIIIALMIYSIINKHFIDYQRQSLFVNNVSQFINTFENDLNTTFDVEIKNNEILIKKASLQCIYLIDEHSITRSVNDKRDTVLASISQIEVFSKDIDKRSGMISFRFLLTQDTLIYKSYYSRNVNLNK